MKDRFSGDGRKKIAALPEYVLDGTKPRSITVGTARRIIDNFNQAGHSTHRGTTLWVLIEYCKVNKIPHEILTELGVGYYIKKTKGEKHDQKTQ